MKRYNFNVVSFNAIFSHIALRQRQRHFTLMSSDNGDTRDEWVSVCVPHNLQLRAMGVKHERCLIWIWTFHCIRLKLFTKCLKVTFKKPFHLLYKLRILKNLSCRNNNWDRSTFSVKRNSLKLMFSGKWFKLWKVFRGNRNIFLKVTTVSIKFVSVVMGPCSNDTFLGCWLYKLTNESFQVTIVKNSWNEKCFLSNTFRCNVDMTENWQKSSSW